MERRVSKDELLRDMDELLIGIVDKGDTVIIQQEGEPIAVLVPVQTYKHLRRAQETEPNEDSRHEHAWPRRDVRDETAD